MSAPVIADALRQMVAVLQEERQALAAMDLDAIMVCANGKQALCDRLGSVEAARLDPECVGLVQAARQLNDVNRRVRNLLAANVEARLDALAGSGGLYHPRRGPHGAAGFASHA